jgi:hypothetical protein
MLEGIHIWFDQDKGQEGWSAMRVKTSSMQDSLHVETLIKIEERSIDFAAATCSSHATPQLSRLPSAMNGVLHMSVKLTSQLRKQLFDLGHQFGSHFLSFGLCVLQLLC